jgi:hypothetical protein
MQVSHVLHWFDQLLQRAVAIQRHDGVYVWRLLHVAKVLAERRQADLFLLLRSSAAERCIRVLQAVEVVGEQWWREMQQERVWVKTAAGNVA